MLISSIPLMRSLNSTLANVYIWQGLLQWSHLKRLCRSLSWRVWIVCGCVCWADNLCKVDSSNRGCRWSPWLHCLPPPVLTRSSHRTTPTRYWNTAQDPRHFLWLWGFISSSYIRPERSLWDPRLFQARSLTRILGSVAFYRWFLGSEYLNGRSCRGQDRATCPETQSEEGFHSWSR